MIKVNDTDLAVTQIGNIVQISGNSRAKLVMRLHFLVHTFINLYVYSPQEQLELVGYRMRERS